MTLNLTLTLSVALLAGTAPAFAASDQAVQGRPMGGLAMSMQDEQAMEAASLARAKPTPAQKRAMLKANMKKNAM